MTTQVLVQRFLRLPEVLSRVGASKASLYRQVAAGRFPKPVKLFDARSSGWAEEEVNAWIAARLASRDGE